MMPSLGERFGNPHSEHLLGLQAAEAVEDARCAVADLVGAAAGEVLLTSGATEANNLAILGIAARSRHWHILTSSLEHKSVLGPLSALMEQGWEVETLPVGKSGVLSVEMVERALRPDTALVSVMAANNEIGTLQPILEIGALCAGSGVLFHCDAAQLVGKRPT